MEQLEVGRRFEGKYRIVRQLGSGAFGAVYLAHQEGMDRQVALKVLKPQVDPNAEADAKERFLREVRVIARLRHPNTVTIHDFGESDDGVLFMVLEYIDGETLNERLHREGAFPPIRALRTAEQIGRSLAEAHRHGVVHRDLKPANIMISHLEGEGDFVKVLDFGVAQILHPKDKDFTDADLPDDEAKMVGTPRYMSPEQICGEPVDARSDVYCLGLLVYEMLVGEPAVEGDTTVALVSEHISREPLELEGLGGFPREIRRVVRTCCAKDPESRYLTTDEVVRDIQDVAAEFGADFSKQRSGPKRPVTPAGPDEKTDAYGEARDSGATSEPVLDSNLPPPPDDEASFVDRERESVDRHAGRRAEGRSSAAAETEDVDASPDDPKAETVWTAAANVLGLGLLLSAAAIGIYLAFIVISTVFTGILSGRIRALASFVLALLLPLVTAIDELRLPSSSEEESDLLERIGRMLLAAAIVSLGSGILVSVAFPNKVVSNLRSQPNWFLSKTVADSGIGQANRFVSGATATFVATTTGAIGLYDSSASAPPSPRRVAPHPGPEETPGRDRPRSALELMKEGAQPDAGSREDENSRPPSDPSEGNGSRDDDGSYREW